MDEQIKLLKELKKDYVELISLYDSRLIKNTLDKKVCRLSEEIEDLEYEHRKN